MFAVAGGVVIGVARATHRRRWMLAVAAGAAVASVVAGCGKDVSTAAAATFSPAALTFGPQAVGTNSAVKTVTLTNTGGAALAIRSLATTGDFLQANTCPTLLVPGASCTISVIFAPVAVGSRSGTVTVTDDASNSPQTVPLSGAGGSLSAAVR